MSKLNKKTETSIELIGRELEIEQIAACIKTGRSVLLEGPVGSGKTHLALSAIKQLKKNTYRVDGDSRYSEQKLTGWFDPPSVIKSGYSEKSFIAGPLTQAMKTGSILFINELNRLPEGVQNILLPAIDEKQITIPRLGSIRAKEGFSIVATQNPKEFVATSHLSEALLDRFELLVIHYQSFEEEFLIVKNTLQKNFRNIKNQALVSEAAVKITRQTREHPKIKRGASVRAAIAIAELTCIFLTEKKPLSDALRLAVRLALPTRIELDPSIQEEGSLQEGLSLLLQELLESTLQDLKIEPSDEKKNF